MGYFRFHLGTLCAVVMTMGLFLWLNLTPNSEKAPLPTMYREYGYGWPADAYSTIEFTKEFAPVGEKMDLPEYELEWLGVLCNLSVSIFTVVGVGFCVEAFLRKRDSLSVSCAAVKSVPTTQMGMKAKTEKAQN